MPARSKPPVAEATALEIEQIEHLIRTTPVAWLLSMLGALICYVQFMETQAGHSLDWWFGAFCAVSLARLVAALFHVFSRLVAPLSLLPRGRPMSPSRAWVRGWLASTLVHAAQWGMLPFVLLSPGTAQAESILHMTLVAIAMGGSVRLPGFPRILVAHVLLVLAPLILRDLLLADTYLALMVLLVFLIGVYALASGRNQSRVLRELQTQRERNEELITELQHENQRSEAARHAAEQASAARTRFFAAANHDLRQPLHAMGLLSQTLIDRPKEVDVDEVARHIGECVDGMALVIDDLLEITRLDVGNLAPQWSVFSLQELVRECSRPYEPLARVKGLQMVNDVPALVVRTDRALLSRVLSNLLFNAIRYTTQGHVRVHAVAGEHSVQVRVEDTGIGIASGDLPRIFDEFYQVGNPARDRRLGLGLGLATVQRLSDLLGLGVSVESELGRGSTFSLILPLAAGSTAPNATPHPLPVAETSFPSRRVLVVEDDADSRAALVGLLRSWGCDVQSATNAPSSLQIVRDGFRAEALVVDLRLADGASGIDAVHELRQALDDEMLPALIVTGDAGSDQLESARDFGLAAMVKPVRPVRLRAFLAHAFAQASLPQA
ncbi:hybrid sensor histidine kinase/response regulator [Hydrogenophaga sp.]|uniref:ATP-binding response regulator n=1 Tax=Hydrogenophaga sp. TaxID=1904254 RepID=UPI00272F786C|nr:hybrid sensor histidine kinase/response regulator [Hydrogenophaga sp.]MDP2074125.1 ATP-binding protein [Hydrogenophaga sp.]MDP3109829.1 ATP-binding protein [Hydrogenophaga sp.]MDP3350794.1 ATP-binding protein [Hydrogenophaga sp.]